jgi:hypothetical protein
MDEKHYEKRYEDVCNLGFYFTDKQVFVDFMGTIETFGKKEINYYNTFKNILPRIVRFEAGVPSSYYKKDEIKETVLLTIEERKIKVKYKVELSKDNSKRFQICEIEVCDNDTLRGWSDTRYQPKSKS